MELYLILLASLLVNALLGWYLVRILRKFLFISQEMSDLFLTLRSFEVFASSLYSMDSYHGEPIIQQLITRLREVLFEVETFRDIFQYTLDEEMEEELNAAQESTKE